MDPTERNLDLHCQSTRLAKQVRVNRSIESNSASFGMASRLHCSTRTAVGESKDQRSHHFKSDRGFRKLTEVSARIALVRSPARKGDDPMKKVHDWKKVNSRAEIPLETETGMSDGPEIAAGFGTELIEKV